MNTSKSRLLTRREFISQSLTLAAAATSVPLFLSRTALALQHPLDSPLVKSPPGIPDERILGVVQLSGGKDGLNTVIPFENDAYYRARPTLAIPKDKVLRLDDQVGFPPSLVSFKRLYDTGALAIVQGVGYPNPDRSHFRSMEIWKTGFVEGFATTGWIGRLFDHTCGNAHLKECNPTLGISVGETLNPALRGQTGVGVVVRDPEQLYRITFSEFGRRVAENGSRGTDHGKAAPMFIFGQPIKAGLIGNHPSLDSLNDGDLTFKIDFRSVYATVLEDWLGVESEIILGQRFEKVKIV